MTRKSIDERALPPYNPNRETNWEVALQHGGLVNTVVREALRKFDSIFKREIKGELEDAAWEGMLRAVETYDNENVKVAFSTWAYTIVKNHVYTAIRYAIAQRGGTLNNRVNDKVIMPLRFGVMEQLWNDTPEGMDLEELPWANTASGLVEPDFVDELLETMEVRTRLVEVMRFIDEKMDGEVRELFRLKYVEGLPRREVFKKMGIGHSRYYKLLKLGREQLEEAGL